MDKNEADYLRQQIRELERAKNRWKAATVFLLAAFALFLVLGMGSVLTYGLFGFNSAARRARDAEMLARERAEAEMRARQAEMQAQEALEKVGTGKDGKPQTRADGSEKQDAKR
jgi:hypothetical protein